ncbi:MAG TPA: 3-deoxy-8-phosphooctulonate synthase, partial [Emticicia sp.]
KTNKVVNVKKGQFLSPDAMKFIVEKIRSVGNNKVMLTERGTMFGYHDLVVDFTGIPTMQANDVPVIVDCTHSLQKPNQKNGVSGGSPQFIETLAKAAVAIGSEGIFIETHPNPSLAKSDGKSMVEIKLLDEILIKLVAIRNVISL